jgi:hypothetical protein
MTRTWTYISTSLQSRSRDARNCHKPLRSITSNALNREMHHQGLISCLEEILIAEIFVLNPVHFGPFGLRPRQAGLKRQTADPCPLTPTCMQQHLECSCRLPQTSQSSQSVNCGNRHVATHPMRKAYRPWAAQCEDYSFGQHESQRPP